jgi:adenylate kinase
MNIMIFGPNGSGKGTQGAILQKKYGISHVESGAIFRDNIAKGTELGKKAKAYIDRGDLVPDDITIPMILDRLSQDDCKKGWLLDGFPRNPAQAETLYRNLKETNIQLDYVIEISLDKQSAKNRIMGRRLCVNDPNHPNNIFIAAIRPVEKGGELVCRVCGGALKTRADDQDEAAINKRHDIYYDPKEGTTAAISYYKNLAANSKTLKFIVVDGTPGVGEVTESLMKELD